jgi:LmbE family N-acetylglucosaminyl deacetylase
MRAWLCSTMAALAACGGGGAAPAPDAAPVPDAAPLPDAPPAPGPAFAPAADLAIVAHPADDLVLLQPALYDAVQAGTGVTNIYVTAGAGGLPALQARIAGLEAAYSAIAGTGAWACGDVVSGGHHLWHCRLAAARLSLIFIGYPDGGGDGSAPTSLLHLWQADVTSVMTVTQPASTYDQASLIQTLADLIDVTAPTTLRTLEIAATHGRDESDHMMAGALAVLATAASTQDPAMVSARGDNISDAAANVDPAIAARSAGPLERYAACASQCATCGDACTLDRLDPEDAGRLQRSYPIAMRTAAGLLRTEAGCVTVTVAGANAAIGDCATAPSWTLDAHGRLRASAGLCLRALFTGEIVTTPCADDGIGGRFFFDDEGHLWSGIVPAPADNLALAHLDCMVNAGGRPRVALCGAARAPTWQLTP